MTPGPWLGWCIVLAVLAGLLAALSALAERFGAETTRKALHVGMGLATLALPWLFNEAWPVVVLGIVVGSLFVALRRLAPLRGVGRALHAVQRNSLGEFYFVLAAVVIFVLAAGETVLFLIPILILTLADPAAALIGTRFGSRRYPTGAGKSVEGSLAFLVTAFYCAYLPLLLLTPNTAYACSILAALVAATTTLCEAVSDRGLDNLVVPLSAFVALQVVHPVMPAPAVGFALIGLGVFLTIAALRLLGTSRHERAL